MENIANKIDFNTGDDGKLPASEYNDRNVELQGAVEKTGQVLNISKTNQLAQTFFINGTGAAAFIIAGGDENDIEITPSTGDDGIAVAESYALLNDCIVRFIPSDSNNQEAVTIDIGQTTGTLLGPKSLKNVDGSDLIVNQLNGECFIKWDNSNDYWVLINVVNYLKTEIINTHSTNSRVYNSKEGVAVTSLGTFEITGMTAPKIVGMNETDLVFADFTVNALKYLRWNGSTFTQIGIDTPITASDNLAMAKVNETDIAFLSIADGTLSTYRWNGNDFDLLGSALTVTGMSGYCTLSAYSPIKLAMLDGGNDQIRNYTRGGSAWVQTSGTASNTGISDLTACSYMNIALMDQDLNLLKMFRRNASNVYTLIGNAFTILNTNPSITSLGEDIVISVETGSIKLSIHRFDGVDWYETFLDTPESFTEPSITAMGHDVFAIANADNDLVTYYRVMYSDALPSPAFQ